MAGTRRWMMAAGLLAAWNLSGCVSLWTYQELQEKYEHVVDAKLDMDRDYAESRRQLLAVEEQHARLSGQIDSLNETVEAKIRAAIGPLSADLAKLQAERTTALRERAREEITEAERHRAVIERVDHLAKQVDRLNDRVTRAEVVASRSAQAPAPQKKTAQAPRADKAASPSAKSAPSDPALPPPAESAPAAAAMKPLDAGASGSGASGSGVSGSGASAPKATGSKDSKEGAGSAVEVPPSPLSLAPRAEAATIKPKFWDKLQERR